MAEGNGGAPGTVSGGMTLEQPVTLKTLAQHLGLSPATVSLVINRAPAARSIPEKTKQRVLAAAREFDYRPNQVARSLRSKRSFTVGVLLPEIREGYAADILGGIESHLVREGYFFLVASFLNREDLLEKYLRLLRDRTVEGYVMVNTALDTPPPLPSVVVSGHRQLAGVTNVSIDHDRAAHLALGHLKSLGHERIAFFKGHKKSSDTDDRWRAIVDASRELGLEVRPELTLQLASAQGGFTPEEGYREGYLFGQMLLARRTPFTCLFAFNDLSAIGAMRAFRDAGRRVPEDLSVVGFDDISSSAFQIPRLTTVRQPLREMGEIAARTLLRRLGGDASFPDTVTVEPELMIRESTAAAAASQRRSRRLTVRTALAPT